MASKNFSLDLPDNFVRLEARKSVPGVGEGEDQQVGGGGGGGCSLMTLCSDIPPWQRSSHHPTEGGGGEGERAGGVDPEQVL